MCIFFKDVGHIWIRSSYWYSLQMVLSICYYCRKASTSKATVVSWKEMLPPVNRDTESLYMVQFASWVFHLKERGCIFSFLPMFDTVACSDALLSMIGPVFIKFFEGNRRNVQIKPHCLNNQKSILANSHRWILQLWLCLNNVACSLYYVCHLRNLL